MAVYEEESPGTASELDTDVPVAANATEEAGISSTANDDKTPEIVDVVRDVVAKRVGGDKAAAASSADEQSGTSPASDAKGAKEPDDEGYSDVPFHKHPRFRQLLSERNNYRVGSEQFRKVQTYLDTNGIAPTEFVETLEVVALMKRDPRAAWEQKLKPFVTNLLHEIGEVLPPDIQQRVQRGEMSREAAAEFSRLQAQSQITQRQREIDRQRVEQQRQHEIVTARQAAAGDWWAEQTRKDPALTAREDEFLEVVLRLKHVDGEPTSPQEVRAQLEKANGILRQRAKAAAPRPKPMNPITGGRPTGNHAPEPSTTLDVIRAVRAAR